MKSYHPDLGDPSSMAESLIVNYSLQRNAIAKFLKLLEVSFNSAFLIALEKKVFSVASQGT